MDKLRFRFQAFTWIWFTIVLTLFVITDHHIVPKFALPKLLLYAPSIASYWGQAELAQAMTLPAAFLLLFQCGVMLWRKWFWKIFYPELDVSGEWHWMIIWDKASISRIPKEHQSRVRATAKAASNGRLRIVQDMLSISVLDGMSKTKKAEKGAVENLAANLLNDCTFIACHRHVMDGNTYLVVDQLVVSASRQGLWRRGRPVRLEGRFPDVHQDYGFSIFGTIVYSRCPL